MENYKGVAQTSSSAKIVAKFCAIAVLFSLLPELAFQFIFSYGNQSEDGPHLSFIGFALPFLLTILILPFSTVIFCIDKASKKPFSVFTKSVLFLLLSALIVWQIWHLAILYNIRKNMGIGGKISEMLPLTAGFVATFFLLIRVLKN